jgi:2-keto-4-pentenoate hydratase
VGAPDAVTEPNAAPIYDVRWSPAEVSAPAMQMHGIEAEIAVVFAHALPPRSEPYAEAEVMAAVAEIRVAIELCDSRLEDWESADDATRLADHQLNYALVLGDRCADWRAVDFAAAAVCTRVDGGVIAAGKGCHAVGNPMLLLPWLANHARLRGGLGAGTAVTTGAWLGLHRVAPGASVQVEFAGLGAAEVIFTRA